MQKRHYPAIIGAALLLALSTAYLNSLVEVPTSRAASELQLDLSASRYQRHIGYLAGDAMKGRGDGSPELDQAADYIAQQFRIAGLRPAGAGNTYFQNFEITTGAKPGGRNELQLGGTRLNVNEDFVPILFSNTAEFEGRVAFAGYGITAPEMHYDDYRGVEAAGKIVVVFRHGPQELDAKSPFAGTNFTSHASFINKAINARQHGAKGIVFITDPNNHEKDDVGPATRQVENDDMGIPSVHARRDVVMRVFKEAGKDLA